MNLPAVRSSGIMLVVAGLLFGSFMFFHPPNTPQGAIEAIWVPVHSIWFCSYLLIVCSLVLLYPLTSAAGVLGTFGYWLSFLGSVLSLPIAVWDSFIVPYLASHAPDFILQIEEISTETPVLVFRIIFFLTVIAFSIGFIIYSISLVRLQLLPIVAGVCLALGAPLFWVGAIFISKTSLSNIVTEMGAVLFGIGLVVLGSKLLSIPLQSRGNNTLSGQPVM
jgi:hypothetical protein